MSFSSGIHPVKDLDKLVLNTLGVSLVQNKDKELLYLCHYKLLMSQLFSETGRKLDSWNYTGHRCTIVFVGTKKEKDLH